MAVTPATFRPGAAEFGGLGDPEIQAAIDAAVAQLSVTAWGTQLDRATFLLAAHGLTTDHPGARPGEDATKNRYIAEFDRLRDNLCLTGVAL
jgi:hypothetical protein